MIKDIERHIEIINQSIDWAKRYKKESFPVEQFKDYRRKLKKIRGALTDNCSAAAYGESQVGKSYLMSSLLSSPDHPFVIKNNGKEYSFINELNTSGGETAQVESTGVITRFTINQGNADSNSPVRDMVKIDCLNMVDIILLLTDSYYNDTKINAGSVLRIDKINEELVALSKLWERRPQVQKVITEDDIYDIHDYIGEVIGNKAVAVFQSDFARTIAPIIGNIPAENWVDVFSLLWNKNPEVSRLFTTLVKAYGKIGFSQEVYVPFDAVLRDKGTLLKINWLDSVCGNAPTLEINETSTTDIFSPEGKLLAADYDKGELSALIAEVTFNLPEEIAEERKFLRKMDLLDFPGAREREIFPENKVAENLPQMLRRGKVAYLFNKYSRSLRLSSVLLCHHNNQKSGPTVGETVNEWIEANIGSTPAERASMLRDTNGISPLFFVATKFNIDLEHVLNNRPDNPESLDTHWKRFDTIFPEIVNPNRWLEEWSAGNSGSTEPFRSIYPLRDFYWSARNNLFDGYDIADIRPSETQVHPVTGYPDYFDRLKESFIRNEFVSNHFRNPDKAWDEFATPNNDGSKAVIRDLDAISGVLDEARRNRYLKQLKELKDNVINTLRVHYEPEDMEGKNKKVRLIAGDIRRSLMHTVSSDPAAFGRIIDSLMVNAEALRNIAYNIIRLHTDTPRDFSALNFIRAGAGVDLEQPREVNIRRLLDYYILDDEDQLSEYLKTQGFELEDMVSREELTLSTIGDVITKHLIDYWIGFLNRQSEKIKAILPHAQDVVDMLIKLFRKLNVRRRLAEKITRYTEIFSENEQLNAIGDFAALTFNDFVSNVGRHFMTDNEIEDLKVKAMNCNLASVDFSPATLNKTRRRQPLMDTLRALDESAVTINQGRIDMNVLRQLPFWNNYQRWENFLFIGLIASSDITNVDPESNEKVKKLIDNSNTLYN